MTLTVNGARLRADLERLATFGGRPDGSVNRPALSPEDVAARRWFARRAREAGLAARIDGLLNVLIGDDSPEPAVWTGSHLDTVPDGGKFDGALGAVAALECLRRLREEDIPLARPVRAVAFSDEEGSFLGFLGSKGMAGGLGHVQPYQVYGPDGRTLADALREGGGDITAADVALPAGAVRGFIELHIEQGPVLEATSTQIGVVTSIVGISRASVRFEGRPDHAGTTPMDARRDALRGAADLLAALPSLPASVGRPAAVITCGRATTLPGAANVVPATAVLELDFRDETSDGLALLEQAIAGEARACAARHDLTLTYTRESTTPPAQIDPALADLVERCAKRLSLSTRLMPSGAAHDSQVMADVAPTGMIFVPSRDGRSHSFLEATDWDDVVNGANVLLQVLHELASH